jgi:hypothetical protein
MIVASIIMLASIFLSWRSLCRPRKEPAKLKVVLVSVRAQALAAGVVVFTALMPAVVSGAHAWREGHARMLPLVYGLEAALCVTIILMKIRFETRVRDEWQARMWATMVHGGIV